MKSSLAKLALSAALLSVACRDNAANARAKADSDLARDLALAGAQTQQTPTFKDTAMAPAPTAATPSPKPEAPAPVRRRTEPRPAPRPQTVAQAPAPAPPPAVVPQPVVMAPAPAPIAEIGSGAAAGMTSGSKVCTSNMPGDKLTATLSSAMTGSNGAVIPAGSTVVLEVASATPGKDASSAQLTFRVRSVVIGDKTYDVNAEASPLDALQQTQVANSDPNAEKKKVAGGAIAGAIIGQIIGHNTKGTLIGAATGAVAGAAASRMGQKWEACLPSGAAMRFKLNAPLIIS
jgi:hypothetical protein